MHKNSPALLRKQGYDVLYYFGGVMKTKTKGMWAAIGFILSIGVYYFLVQGIEWIWSSVCAKHYCMKTLSLAEFLAIEAALIGLYFVVSSLDAWKHQDKYNNAKNRIALINDLKYKIEFSFGYKICSFYNNNISRGENEKKVFRMGLERDYIIACFKAYLKDTNIIGDIRNLDRENYNVKNCLYQKDFDEVIDLAYKYIEGCNIEIKKLKVTKDDTRESYEKELTKIYKRHRNYDYYFRENLKKLNIKLNNFIE